MRPGGDRPREEPEKDSVHNPLRQSAPAPDRLRVTTGQLHPALGIARKEPRQPTVPRFGVLVRARVGISGCSTPRVDREPCPGVGCAALPL